MESYDKFRRYRIKREQPISLAIDRFIRLMIRSNPRRPQMEHIKLYLEWPKIVGAEFSRHSQFDRIQFPYKMRAKGCVYIRSHSSFGLTLQNYAPILIARVNAYLGYPAVSSMRLVDVPLRK